MQELIAAPIKDSGIDKDYKSNRDASIDLLKTVAIIGVITIHISASGYSNSLGSFNWISSLFWGTLTRASVPIFLMCSGAVLLNPQKELSLKKLFSNNLLRIIIAMFFWAMAYKIYHLLAAGKFSLELLYESVKEVLLFNQEFHLYYLHIIILVYVFLPITRIIIRNASKKQLQYLLAVWFVFGIIYPTVKSFWPFTLISGIPNQWFINMTYASIGYGVLGYYLKHFPLSKRRIYLMIFAIGFTFVFGVTWYLSTKQGVLYSKFLEGMTVGIALMAVGLFGYFVSNKKEMKYTHIVTYISKASFCVYLVHVFFIIIPEDIGLTVHILPCAISIPLVVAVNLACSCGIYAVLSRIPMVNRWLV